MASRLHLLAAREAEMRNSPLMMDLVCALARYLRANPLACDSLDGIARWWLAGNEFGPEDLMQALAWMVEQGLVEELVAADGRMRYRRRGPDGRLDALIDALADGAGTRH
jgi:hypothetical protein